MGTTTEVNRVPRSPEEITPEWLTAALRSTGVIREANVTSVSTQGIGAGAGFLGQLAKVAVTYDREEQAAPRSMIFKVPTLDPGGREVSNLFRFYEREICFYREIAPEVELRTPRCYFSHMDIPGDDYVLLLEDLAPARFGDEVGSCALKDAETAIRNLASFHASWWEHPRLETLEWMPYVNAPVHQSAEQSYNQAWEPFVQMFGEFVPERVMPVAEDMKTHVIDLLNLFEPRPRTIIHGDYRLDNLFFDHPDGSEVASIDWQISSRGRGMFDVAYFMSSCLEPEVRREHETRLLRLWHDTVSDRVSTKGYSLDDVLLDYRRGVLYTNIYTVIGIGSLDAKNERGMALFHKWLKRRAAAIEDLDCAEVMPA
jgi:hypothetical protein